MTSPASREERGIVYTFYSFKGGVGRTMALANVAVLLAKWGYSVLAVDWDLEAPGLEQFFSKLKPEIRKLRKETPGIVDLVRASTNGAGLNWRDCLLDITINGGKGHLSVLSAGRNDGAYASELQSLNFPELFDKHGLGSYIETLRNEWIAEFDFVLIDSRTGVTDIGGICTVHLADILVLLFTANDSSSEGALDSSNAPGRLNSIYRWTAGGFWPCLCRRGMRAERNTSGLRNGRTGSPIDSANSTATGCPAGKLLTTP